MSNIIDGIGKFDQSKAIAGHIVTKFKNMPETLPISCPMLGFKVGLAAKRCPGCQYFEGLLCMDPEDKPIKTAQEFRNKYRVLCSYPIARSLGSPMEDL